MAHAADAPRRDLADHHPDLVNAGRQLDLVGHAVPVARQLLAGRRQELHVHALGVLGGVAALSSRGREREVEARQGAPLLLAEPE